MPNIIGGKFKRTKIEVPNKFVRPTSAIKREAIFSILESYSIKNSIEIYKKKSIIDIFAGSGLIGLEAISRGINKSYFIDNNHEVIKVLKKNCQKICHENEYEIIFSNAIDSLDKNFYSCFLILNELKNFLIKSKSKIICISSICGTEIIKNAPISYSISKSLLNIYLKHLSKSFAKNGVNLNIISPGNIIFDGSTWDKKMKKNKKNTIKYVKDNVPVNKFGSPKDIANAVFFLSSKENNFISGVNLLIDGGQTN